MQFLYTTETTAFGKMFLKITLCKKDISICFSNHVDTSYAKGLKFSGSICMYVCLLTMPQHKIYDTNNNNAINIQSFEYKLFETETQDCLHK